jgi:hypothetical protein
MSTKFTIEVLKDGDRWKAIGLSLESVACSPSDAVSSWLDKMRHVSELDLVHNYAEKHKLLCKTSASS